MKITEKTYVSEILKEYGDIANVNNTIMKSLILTTVIIFLFFPILMAQYPLRGNWKNEETGSSVEFSKRMIYFMVK